MKVAAIQMVSTPDVARNLVAARQLLQQAADAGAELAVLPEYFCLLGRKDTDKLAIAEQPTGGPLQDFLSQRAVGDLADFFGSDGDRAAHHPKLEVRRTLA